MKSSFRVVMLIGFVVALAARAEAAPIVYLGTLPNGVAVAGINGQVAGNPSTPAGADYWQFFATAGSLVNVFGDRQAGHYDMSFWIFSGLYADTSDFGPSFPGLQAANFIAFGDDQDPPNIAGPFGDPNVSFIAPSTGGYTVAVTNFLSSAGPPNPYTLTATGITAVPEPASMLLLGSGISGLIAARRRRARKARVQ
jgi:hypothetical protein